MRGSSVLSLLASAGAMAAVSVVLTTAEAQKLDPRRPAVFVVGPPQGASPMQRVNARRTGESKAAFPSGTLGTAWRKTTGLTLDQPVLAGADGSLAVVSVRGDVTFLDDAGEELAQVKVGAAQIGPAAMTSDGTVVYATHAGEVIGVRRTSPVPRFSSRIGGDRNVRAAPLPLDDGGVVVATLTDLIVLDAEGNVRSRVSLPETPDAPLLASGDKVLAVTRSGAVYGWTPGREPVRVGSFMAPVDGGAVLLDAGLLVAVIEGNHLAQVDVTRGGRSTRSIAPQGLYLGPPSARTTKSGALTTLLSLTHTREFVLTLDAAGRELVRAPIASFSPPATPDGGVPPLVAPPHTGTLVDARGAVAFAATDGHVGVVSPEGAVEALGEILCAKGARSGIVGLTPVKGGAFAVTCDGGTVIKVTSTSALGAPDARSAPDARGGPAPDEGSESLRKPASSPPSRPPPRGAADAGAVGP